MTDRSPRSGSYVRVKSTGARGVVDTFDYDEVGKLVDVFLDGGGRLAFVPAEDLEVLCDGCAGHGFAKNGDPCQKCLTSGDAERPGPAIWSKPQPKP
jgi:hypothetical protein